MLDTKTSCLLRGIVGVLFGFLALMLPEPVLVTFSGLFLVLVGLGMALFLFLAITSKSDESMIWFGLAAALLIIGVLSFVFAGFVAILFILIIAAVAAYNGFSDITLALRHHKTKFFIIPAMILSGIVLLVVFYYYFPNFDDYLELSVLGTLALVFGLYSIALGYYKPEEGCEDEVPMMYRAATTFKPPKGK